MSTATLHRLTDDEYLALERVAVSKSEFFDGEMIPMSGASEVHNFIGGNLYFAFYHLEPSDFSVYTSEMKVKIPSGGFTYPDLCIAGHPAVLAGGTRHVLLNPLLIAEVLSPSTEAYDRGLKFSRYREIDSLQTYILVSQDRPCVEVYSRQTSGHWSLKEYRSGEILLATPSIELSLTQIYRRVDFSLAEHSSDPDHH